MFDKRILVTGGTGLLGMALNKEIQSSKTYKEYKIKFISSEYDLTKAKIVEELFLDFKPTHVFHLAAKVGGLGANINYPADFYYHNVMMNTNVLHYSHIANVEKVVSVLSTCVYPQNVKYPLQEHTIHDGIPHRTNFAYAHAKRMLHIQSLSYRRQFNKKFVCAIPNNLMGEYDNFRVDESHVIPAIIRKIWTAKIINKPCVLWGTGSPLREFTYARDAARALLWMMEYYDFTEIPLNIGNTNEFSIEQISEKIAGFLEFQNSIIWDMNMPDGQFKKPSCNDRFLTMFRETTKKNFEYTDFDYALMNTCNWFKENYFYNGIGRW